MIPWEKLRHVPQMQRFASSCVPGEGQEVLFLALSAPRNVTFNAEFAQQLFNRGLAGYRPVVEQGDTSFQEEWSAFLSERRWGGQLTLDDRTLVLWMKVGASFRQQSSWDYFRRYVDAFVSDYGFTSWDFSVLAFEAPPAEVRREARKAQGPMDPSLVSAKRLGLMPDPTDEDLRALRALQRSLAEKAAVTDPHRSALFAVWSFSDSVWSTDPREKIQRLQNEPLSRGFAAAVQEALTTFLNFEPLDFATLERNRLIMCMMLVPREQIMQREIQQSLLRIAERAKLRSEAAGFELYAPLIDGNPFFLRRTSGSFPSTVPA